MSVQREGLPVCLLSFPSGFSQPGGIGMNVEVGAAPLQAEKPPSIADPQILTPPAGSVAPKEHSPMLPEPQAPRSPLDVSAGKTHALNSHATVFFFNASFCFLI